VAINHANFAETTLGAAITTTDGTSITVSSSAGFPNVDFIIAIDTEVMLVTNVSGTTWTVTRGYESSTAATHLNGATVYHNISAGEVDALVDGPASATDGNLAVFNGTTGKLIKDGGANLATRNVTIAIPAMAMVSPTTGGALLVNYETGTYAADYFMWEFVDAAARYIDFFFPLPINYDGGTVTAKFYWTANSTSTNPVEWRIKGVAMADDGTMVVDWGTAQVISDAGKAAAYDLSVTAATPALTIAGTPTGGKLVHFRVDRNYASANDTLAATAYLLAVQLTVGLNAWTE